MKKSEIVIGGHYRARISGNFVTVRVEKIRQRAGYKDQERTVFDVLNLDTGRRTTFDSAAKFRSVAKGPTPASVRYKEDEESDPLAMETENPCPFVELTDSTVAGVTTPSSDSPKTAPATKINCPRCGASVTVENGRYSYHKYATKGNACRMGGGKVRSRDAGDSPFGDTGMTVSEATKEANKLREGKQGSDPLKIGSETKSGGLTIASDSGGFENWYVKDGTGKPVAGPYRTQARAEEQLLIERRRVKSDEDVYDVPASALPGLLSNLKTTEDNSPHVIVEARAGTGKTFSLVVGIVWKFRKLVPGLWDLLIENLGFEPTPSTQQLAIWEAMELGTSRTIKFVAFNKSIVSEFEHKWGWVIHALATVGITLEFSTMHSMGFKTVTKALGRMEPNQYVVQDIIAELLGRDLRELRRDEKMVTVLKAAEHLTSLCKVNLIGFGEPEKFSDGLSGNWWDEQLAELCERYDVDLNGSRRQVFDLVPHVLERCKEPKGKITFDDMIWLPVVLNLPVFRYDLLLIDEAQDLNRCQQALAKKAGKRLILCGDPKQAIYQFAGADSESMERMRTELSDRTPIESTVCILQRGCVTLPLTVTRRCGKKIVAEARKYVPDFSAHESNPEGEIKHARYPIYKDSLGVRKERPWEETYGPLVGDGDMVLCRTNAPIVNQCFRFLRMGRKANIQGRDVGQGLIGLVKKSKADTVVQLIAWLDNWLHAEGEKERAKRNPSETRLTGFQDRHDCILCFTEGQTTAEGVIAKIEGVFTDDKDKPGVRFSSIHRAKGLESRKVFILYPPDSGPRRDKMQPWEIQSEENLCYVACTRAIETLVFVS